MPNATEGYEKVQIPPEKIEALINFLLEVSQGPQEAIGMLHAAIVAIDTMNAELRNEPPRSAERLGQELTACLLLSKKAMQ